MRRQLVPSVISMVIFTVILGIGFPLVILGIGQVAFKDKAEWIDHRAQRQGGRLVVDRPGVHHKKGDPFPSTSSRGRRRPPVLRVQRRPGTTRP